MSFANTLYISKVYQSIAFARAMEFRLYGIAFSTRVCLRDSVRVRAAGYTTDVLVRLCADIAQSEQLEEAKLFCCAFARARCGRLDGA